MSVSLGKIAKGTAITFVGMFIFTFFEFIIRVIFARHTTQNEYGTFSIGFALLNIFVLISCLGLQVGATRYIAYYRGRNEHEKATMVVYSSLQLSIVASICFFLVFFFSSDFLNEKFHIAQPIVLKLFAIAVPFLTIIEVLSYIFIGFDRVVVKVYIRDILMSLLRFTLIILALTLGFGFLGMIYAYILPFVIIAVIFTSYTAKKLFQYELKDNSVVRKELFLFCIPLLVTSISTVIITRLDTLMLGYFKTSDTVGLYNAAYPIAQLIPIFLFIMNIIYVPISSELFSKNLIEELRRNYMVVTKWTFAVTLPFFFLIFLFPDVVLAAVFGYSYVQASDSLRILAVGGFVQTLLGPNAATLIALGKTRLNMMDDLIGVAVNVSLNLFLIPTMGIIGAAIASTASFSVISALKSVQIFSIHGLQPFTKNYLKPFVISTIFIYIMYLLIYPVHLLWMLVLVFFLFMGIYAINLIITRSLDEEDIKMFLELEKLTGMDMSYMKRLLRRFM